MIAVISKAGGIEAAYDAALQHGRAARPAEGEEVPAGYVVVEGWIPRPGYLLCELAEVAEERRARAEADAAEAEAAVEEARAAELRARVEAARLARAEAEARAAAARAEAEAAAAALAAPEAP